jgi:hypothetical protein
LNYVQNLNNNDCVKYNINFTVNCSIFVNHLIVSFAAVLNTNQVAGVNSYKDERTLETLQTKEREHQRRLEIMEKEHEMRLEILRIEKETAEINRDVARKQLLWLSEK